MASIFTRIDDALIDGLFQPVADWLDRQTGLGPARAARMAVDLASLVWILAEAGPAARAVSAHEWAAATTLGVVMLLGLSAFTILRNVFTRSGGAATARRQANPLRAGMQLHRAACCAWVLGLVAKAVLAPAGLFPALALLAVGLCATAAVYLGACTVPPPTRRHAWQGGRSGALAVLRARA